MEKDGILDTPYKKELANSINPKTAFDPNHAGICASKPLQRRIWV